MGPRFLPPSRRCPSMFSAPMFRHEYTSATRGGRPFAFRLTLAVVLGLAALFIGFLVYSANPSDSPATLMLYFGRGVFIATVCIEMFFLAFFVASYVGGSIAEERQKDTLPTLLLTRLTPVEIVVTKAVARWLPAINLTLIGLPLLAAAAWAAGLEFELPLALLMLLSSSAFMASLAILASAQREQRGHVPARRRRPGSSRLVDAAAVPDAHAHHARLALGRPARRAEEGLLTCRPLRAPFSLVTDGGWYSRAGAPAGLEGRMAARWSDSRHHSDSWRSASPRQHSRPARRTRTGPTRRAVIVLRAATTPSSAAQKCELPIRRGSELARCPPSALRRNGSSSGPS